MVDDQRPALMWLGHSSLRLATNPDPHAQQHDMGHDGKAHKTSQVKSDETWSRCQYCTSPTSSRRSAPRNARRHSGPGLLLLQSQAGRHRQGVRRLRCRGSCGAW